MDEQQLANLEGDHQRSTEGWDCSACYADYPCAVVQLITEVRRLRRENHLLNLSRGMPSPMRCGPGFVEGASTVGAD